MEIAIVSLSLIVIGLIVERFLYAKEMNKQLGDAIKAIMSRNINEYLAAKTIEKVTEEAKVEEDEVLLSSLEDKEFDKAIEKTNR